MDGTEIHMELDSVYTEKWFRAEVNFTEGDNLNFNLQLQSSFYISERKKFTAVNLLTFRI